MKYTGKPNKICRVYTWKNANCWIPNPWQDFFLKADKIVWKCVEGKRSRLGFSERKKRWEIGRPDLRVAHHSRLGSDEKRWTLLQQSLELDSSTQRRVDVPGQQNHSTESWTPKASSTLIHTLKMHCGLQYKAHNYRKFRGKKNP